MGAFPYGCMAAGAFFTSRRSEGGYKNDLPGNTARSWKTFGNVKVKVVARRGWAMAKRGPPKRQSLTLSPGEKSTRAALAEAVGNPEDPRRFSVEPASFRQVPNSPLCYWVSERIRRLFKELPPFEGEGRTVKVGLQTSYDFRFVRLWTEVPPEKIYKKWFPLAESGAYSPYYADLHLVVNWENDGAEIKAWICQRYPYLNGKWEWVAKNTDYYFRPGLTWPLRTNGLSFRLLPKRCIFGHKGPAAFAEESHLLALCGVANSKTFNRLVSVQLARTELAQSYEVGLIQVIPLPDGILADDPDSPEDIVRRVREVFEVIWKERAEAIEREACELLGVKELRDYFRNPQGFFADHIKRYSKSHRKAPIYWLLQSPRKSYGLWLYYHRLDKDILFKALTLYVEPKLRLEENRLEEIRGKVRAAAAAGQGVRALERGLEKQEALLSDLQDFRDRLERAAKLYLVPDLDDGVVLNIAPLWELVPWKEAKAYWEELLAGKYPWSSIGQQLRAKGLVK